MIFIVFSKAILRNNFFELIFTKTTFYFLIFIFFILFFNFINSGCLVYPATFTCSENLLVLFQKKQLMMLMNGTNFGQKQEQHQII